MDGVCLKMSIQGIYAKIPVAPSRVYQIRCSIEEKSTVTPPEKKTVSFGLPSRAPRLEIPWSGGGGGVKRLIENRRIQQDAISEDNGDEEIEIGETEAAEIPNGNWVLKILQAGSIWRRRDDGGAAEKDKNDVVPGTVEDRCDECEFGKGRDEEDDENDKEEVEFKREVFLKMLWKVPLAEARLLAKMSHLGNLAYSIPKIKPEILLKHHGLRFVTSSIEKRKSTEVSSDQEDREKKRESNNGDEKIINPTAAYRIAAMAASRLYSHSKSVLPLKSSRPQKDTPSLMATADSVTAVVAAEEEVKQAVADDLKSTRSPPCEWFVCDDDQSGTRLFFIQGSESLASWQANLLFEPVPFEELDVLVHRGIYEAAKGIYEQMLPEVHAHLHSRGKHRAFFRFSGHSLGGSLSLLVNLMLLIRSQAPASSLLPVITFGSPCILCGGDKLLRQLGLPRTHLMAITMHTDIVPRVFSCIYPNRVARILKAVNGKFWNHPCLNKQKLLYCPMGEMMILQPDEKISPSHPLLPSGNGLYVLKSKSRDSDEAEKEVAEATRMFMNSPHPLQILSDPSAYGSEGIIKRDHDMNSYLRVLKHVVRKEVELMKARRDLRNVRFLVAGILRSGRESMKFVSGFILSRSIHVVMMVFLPLRWAVMAVYGVISHHC